MTEPTGRGIGAGTSRDELGHQALKGGHMKTVIFSICFMAAIICLAGAAYAEDNATGFNDPMEVPLLYFSIQPEKYHGQQVVTSGYVSLDFEGTCISAYEPFRSRFIYRNSVWIDIDLREVSNYSHYDVSYHYCTISGKYDMNAKRHCNQFEGTIIVDSIECN